MKKNIDEIAIFALTESGVEIATSLAEAINTSKLIIPERFKYSISSSGEVETFLPGGFSNSLRTNWSLFSGHIFIMATGIVVRQIAGLIKDKTKDPAVVVCDEKGEYAISLLSGHIGGANRLARFAARVVGGQAVITTATDVQGMMAFDELAAIQGWNVINPEMIKVLNTMLLEGKKIAVCIPESMFNEYYRKKTELTHINSMSDIESGNFDGGVCMFSASSSDADLAPELYDIPILMLSS